MPRCWGADDGADLARHGYEFLIGKAWLGPDRGWARRAGSRGARHRPDSRSLRSRVRPVRAWVVLTVSLAIADALTWALRTVDFLDSHMRHPNGRRLPHRDAGRRIIASRTLTCIYWRQLSSTSRRAAMSASSPLADEMVTLFRDHFYDRATQTLAEYFDDRLARVRRATRGRMIEPGHHFEWAWLLAGYQRRHGTRGDGILRARPRGLCGDSRGGSAKRRHLQPGPRRRLGARSQFTHLAQHGAHSGRRGDVRAGGSRSASRLRAERPAPPGALPVACAARHMDRSLRSGWDAASDIRFQPRRSTTCSSHSRRC